MSNLQDIRSIGPMQGPTGAATDPVKAEYEKGKRFFQNKSYGEAAAALHNAMVGYEERNDDNGIANASNQLGNLCLATKDFENAQKHFTRAWELCEKLQDPLSLFALSKSFVDVYIGLEQYDKAVDGALDLLDSYQANNDPRGAVAVLERIGEIYLLAGKRESAADAYRTVASIHRNFGHGSIADSFEEKAATLEAAS